IAFNTNLTECLMDLEQFSLISRPNSELTLIHRVVQSVIKDRLLPIDLERHQTLVCEIGLSAFPESTHVNLLRCRKYQSETISIITEIKDMRTEAVAVLLARMGIFLVEDGKARDGQSLLAIAVRNRRDQFGEE